MFVLIIYHATFVFDKKIPCIFTVIWWCWKSPIGGFSSESFKQSAKAEMENKNRSLRGRTTQEIFNLTIDLNVTPGDASSEAAASIDSGYKSHSCFGELRSCNQQSDPWFVVLGKDKHAYKDNLCDVNICLQIVCIASDVDHKTQELSPSCIWPYSKSLYVAINI